MRTIIFLCLCAVVVVLAQDPLLAVDKQQSLNTWTATNKKIGCVSSLPGTYGNAECLANFISDQMQVKATPNTALPATYRIGWDYVPPVNFYPSSTGAQLSQRADIYDSAIAAIFLLNEGHLLQAKKICDTLVLLVDNEPISDGRLRSAYSAASPIDRQNLPSHWASYASNAVDSSIDTEDQSFVILALTRIYVHTGEYKYLKAAIKIASFIQKQLVGTSWTGYSAGFVYSNGKDENLDFRGIQHNLALYAAADMLYGITRDAQYVQIKDHASTFITNMFDPAVGIYRFSTKNNAEDAWDATHVTSNAQSFVALTAVGDVDRTNQALQYMINKLMVFDESQDDITGKTFRYQGVLFGEGGSGINSENTAIAAMALQFQALRIQNTNPALSSSFFDAAAHLVASLLQMQKYAPQSDGHGIVATPRQEGAVVWSGDEENGESWRYFPVLHTAASAWTGLAIAYVKNGDEYANPFSSYYKKSTNKFFGSSLLAGRAAEPEPLFDSSRPLNIVALISAILFGVVLIGGSVILCIANARIHRRNKELEVRKMSSPIKFSRLSSHTPVDSPMSPGSPSGLTVDTSMGRAVYSSPVTPGEQASFIHNQ